MNMRKYREKTTFLRVAWSFLGVLYRWAGNDPTGLDCSGLVVECLKAIGKLRPGQDLSAQGLFDTFVAGKNTEVLAPTAGALLFWQNTVGHIIHVAICIDDDFCITANGGGRSVKTVEDAVKKNAFVAIRPWDHRRTKPIIANIFMEE